MRKKLFAASTGALALLAATPAFAQGSVDTVIGATFQVLDGCSINGGNNDALINFGVLQNAVAQTANIDASTADAGSTPITISCNVNSTTAAFEIQGGQTDIGGVHNLRGSSTVVPYRLYADPGRFIEYTIGNPVVVGTGNITSGVPFSIIVYGRILAADARAARNDTYTDSVSASLTF